MTTIIVIEGSVHLFGIASSPTVATFVFRHHFATLSDIPEWIKDVVRKSFYVDDLMHSFDTESEGRELKRHLNEAVARGGFELVKWRSTLEELNDEHVPAHSGTPGRDAESRTGVQWLLVAESLCLAGYVPKYYIDFTQ